MLAQRRTIYYIHEEHPIFNYVWGEIDIYDLPLEDRITPKFMQARLRLGVIELKGQYDNILYSIPWNKIPQSEEYKGKMMGKLHAKKCGILIHIPKDAALKIEEGRWPDFKHSEECKVFDAAAFDIIKKVIELENLKK